VAWSGLAPAAAPKLAARTAAATGRKSGGFIQLKIGRSVILEISGMHLFIHAKDNPDRARFFPKIKARMRIVAIE
jgi:hypothetical protein